MSPKGESAGGRGGLRLLFAALALLYLLPVWSVHYLPTTDGPCHLYNSWIIRQYDNRADYPLFSRTFEIHWRPVPNWTSHAVMSLLLWIVPPVAAEKLFVSLYVLVFLFACWWMAGSVAPERAWYGLLGFPFVYNLLFHLGFYNFCLSLACFLLAVGTWWRRRDSLGPRSILALNVLLLLCYFSHLVSLALALFTIGLLWLVTLDRGNWRRRMLHLPALAPQLVLPLWFLSTAGSQSVASGTSLGGLWYGFVTLETLNSVTATRGWINRLLAVCFLAALGLTLLCDKVLRRTSSCPVRPASPPDRLGVAQLTASIGSPPTSPNPLPTPPGGKGACSHLHGSGSLPSDGELLGRAGGAASSGPGQRRPSRWRLAPEDGFLLAAVALLLVYLFSPEGISGGTILKPRLLLYPYLVLLPWFTSRLGRAGKAAGVAVLAALALVNLGFVLHTWRAIDPLYVKYVRTLDKVQRGHTILPLLFDHPGFGLRTPVFNHAVDYVALRKGLVDWDNYEATTDLFPVRFRREVAQLDTYLVEATPAQLPVGLYSDRVDYLHVWGLPMPSPVARHIRRFYEQIDELGPVRLFALPSLAAPDPEGRSVRR